jgi:hypothetical protein
MPKTSIDEDNYPTPIEYEVWASGHVLPVHSPTAKAGAHQHCAHLGFG